VSSPTFLPIGEPLAPAVASKPRILIIDDEENIRSTLEEFISRNGYEVDSASDGKSALALLGRNSYDLVLSDLKMPNVDGAAVIEWVARAHAETPVIVMTGHATIESAIHALRAGAYDYLLKPLSLEEIERTIRNCLEKSRLLRSNAELTETNERLREIERIKDSLLATVSHEFRTPLTTMTGFLSMMDRLGTDNLRPDQMHSLEAIRANVERLDTMIGNLLTLVEAQAGCYQANLEPLRLGDFLDEYFRTSRTVRSHDGFRAEIDGPAREVIVRLDRSRFPLVLSNLLENAIKFAPGPGRVIFRARREENRAHLEMHDDGVGIAPSLSEHIFDRFTQADMTSTREFPGAGLGLAVVRVIVEAHHGTVGLETSELGGACIRVALPISAVPGEN
jgi:signal transduction histidine kinase